MKKKIVRKKYIKAKLSKRLIACLLDFYLSILLSSFPIVLANGIINKSKQMQMNLFFFEKDPKIFFLIALISLFLGYVYYVYIPLKKWNGQTFAKHLFKIKIVNLNDEDVGLKDLILRQILGIFIIEGSIASTSSILRQIIAYITSYNFIDIGMKVGLFITAVSCALIFITRKQQMLHDIISKTYVVEVEV